MDGFIGKFYDNSKGMLTNTSFKSDIYFYDNSRGVLSGSNANLAWHFYDNSSIEMSGSLRGETLEISSSKFNCISYINVNWLILNGNANVKINNLAIAEQMFLYDDSIARIFSGYSASTTLVGDNSELHLYGFDLSFDNSSGYDHVVGTMRDGTFITTEICGNKDHVFLHNSPVPEPGTLLLLASGLFGIAGIRRRLRYI